jgi:hypothetical protein
MGNTAYLHFGPVHTIMRNFGKWMNRFMIGTMALIINQLASKIVAKTNGSSTYAFTYALC